MAEYVVLLKEGQPLTIKGERLHVGVREGSDAAVISVLDASNAIVAVIPADAAKAIYLKDAGEVQPRGRPPELKFRAS